MVTGMGAVTPIGVGVTAFAGALREGRSGVSLLPQDLRTERSTVAARCDTFDPATVLPDAELERLPRIVPLALCAAREAVAAAGLDPGGAGALAGRAGVVLGTGGGGIDFTVRQTLGWARSGRASLWSLTNATHGNLAGELSIHLGLRGPSLCVSTGCASSHDALAVACDLVLSERPGTPGAMVVVGADAHVTPEVLRSMELLRVISTRSWEDEAGAQTASRPFERSRDGFVLGEGAWALVVERASTARAREARALARVRGWAATCDAYHRVRPHEQMDESVRAMRLAVEGAGLEPEGVQVVHYHGTGTVLNDPRETMAVRRVFGRHAERLAGHSIKSMVGHPQGACGLAALVGTLCGLVGADGGEPFVHPTANLFEPDAACDLDYTPLRSRPTEATVALINCLAFGGKNSAVVVEAVRG